MKLVRSLRGDGQPVFRNGLDLPDDRPDPFARLQTIARSFPDRILLTEAGPGGERRSLSYGEAATRSVALAHALRHRYGLMRGDVLASLAPAGIDSLLLKLASLAGGFVHAALPPFQFRDGTVSDANRIYLDILGPKLLAAPPHHPATGGMGAIPIGDLVGPSDAPQGAEVISGEPHSPDDRAAVFFTSGSTGTPKGVVITRGMISSNQTAIARMWPFLTERPPVLVDWLPWHHVFGGLDNIFKVMWNGGTMHVDAAPTSATIGATLDLMRAAAPTLHVTVPIGLKLLLDRLEEDRELAKAVTRDLQAIFFAGAGIEEALWRRLLAFAEANGVSAILSGYGATEAASTICLSPGSIERPGELGQPLPGHEIALVGTDDRMEMRLRGPNVSPAYLTQKGAVALPIDDHGFYCTGDGGRLVARADGTEVFQFDGRLAEDFKLSSGVKVRTGALRSAVLAHSMPILADIVIAGESRAELVALCFLAQADAGDIAVAELGRRLAAWNEENPASSTAIARFAIADGLPSRESGELSDKGQIIQSRFLRAHARLFKDLHDGGGHVPAP